MFQLGIHELLLIAIVALLLVRPNDLPKILFNLGRWYGLWTSWWEQVKVGLYSMSHHQQSKQSSPPPKTNNKDNPD